MDSSFNNLLQIFIFVWASISFLRQIVQYKLVPESLNLFRNFVSLSLIVVLALHLSLSFDLLHYTIYLKWRVLPLVTLGVGLLIESFLLLGSFSLIQTKILSRIPLMAALISYAIFQAQALYIFILSVLLGLFFLVFSFDKVRFEKRIYFKMTFFLIGTLLVKKSPYLFSDYLYQLFLFASILYFFQLQNVIGLKGILRERNFENEVA